MSISIQEKVKKAPKAELHLHIEGSLEPELIFKLAQKNQIILPYSSIEELKKSYDFKDLKSFLDLYYLGAQVLITEEDFYEMTMAYIQEALRNHIVYAEIFFDPQTHTHRNIPIKIVIQGIIRALHDGKKLGFHSKLILCFLRHLPEEDALQTFNQALPFFKEYPEDLIGVGLDSSELGHPPKKFQNVFKLAKQHGLKCVAHAGEEAPASYIQEAIDYLGVSRIDHGIQAIHNEALIDFLAQTQIPLTICPLSNTRLKVIENLKHHPLKALLNRGVQVTINSDDPAYFGGYLNQNYLDIIDAFSFSSFEILVLLENGFKASFLTDLEKTHYLNQLNHFWQKAE